MRRLETLRESRRAVSKPQLALHTAPARSAGASVGSALLGPWRGALGLLVLSALHVAGCSDPFRSCAESLSCEGEGGAGMGGASGFAGASGGTGGTAGRGPSIGEEAGAGGEASPGTATGGTDGTDGTAGEAGHAGEGGSTPMPCDATRSPLEEVCRVTEKSAIFVAPMGNDTGAGTRAEPLASLTRAIELAAEDSKFVVACTGTFRENVVIEGATRVQLYGGFDCSDGWTHGAAAVTVVAPTNGIPLSLNAVSEPVHIEGFAFRAAHATISGESSIAASVLSSPDVTLRNVSLTAGNGAAGAAGKTDPVMFPAASFLDGKWGRGDFSTAAGGEACSFACPAGGITGGGIGGDGDADGAGPMTVQSGGTGSPELGDGKAGLVGFSCAGDGGVRSGTGSNGAAAPPAKPGEGAKDWGLLSASGWQPRAGAPGESGTPGQGGGGGRGGEATAGTLAGGGGGGACGGCGGKGGKEGQGGGGSIALVIIRSGVLLEEAELTTANGGKGGAGAAGQPGQSGGIGGQKAGTGCDGGSGGPGADGGKGGGGAGGISVGILVSGARPATDAGVTITLGNPGAGGLGAASPPANNHGIAGVADKLLAL